MTYTVTITEPGAEPVTVSLEWTTEPKSTGWYIIRASDIDDTLVYTDLRVVFVPGLGSKEKLKNMGSEYRWLGPLPMPPKGE